MNINNKEKLGETNISNEKYEMKIIKYNGTNNIIVEFQDKYKARVHTTYNAFKKGNVKNPFHKSVFNIGYLGQGKYKTLENRKHTKCYNTWVHMLQRCYDPYYLNKKPTYINCFVCKEWHCFQNFAKWWYKHYYECNNERMCLDKDILIKGNKIYSPETCLIVPEKINLLFVKNDKNRNNLPIGVVPHQTKYQIYCGYKNNQIYLGTFKNIHNAWLMYKLNKELVIQSIAEEYKELIPKKLYDAMINYNIEIND